MNFFDVTIRQSDGQLAAEGDGFRLPAPASRQEPLKGYVGQLVTLGIRPEDIYDSDFVAPNINAGVLDAQVDVTELMGNEVFLYLATGRHQYIARVDPRTRAHIGNRIRVMANIDNVHFFDKTTERVIR
jgi:multiple sugar transport system ATP-binding protein